MDHTDPSSSVSWIVSVVKAGQLRRWNDDIPLPACRGRMFLVIGSFRATFDDDEVWVDYIMDSKRDWDDLEWVEERSEVISESR